MTDYAKELQLKKKREYYREWRKNHKESVKASQVKYWAKRAAEQQQTVEIRNKEEQQ